MVRIRTLTRAAGRLNFAPNQERDFPRDVARELIRAGAAEAIETGEAEAPRAGSDDGDNNGKDTASWMSLHISHLSDRNVPAPAIKALGDQGFQTLADVDRPTT